MRRFLERLFGLQGQGGSMGPIVGSGVRQPMADTMDAQARALQDIRNKHQIWAAAIFLVLIVSPGIIGFFVDHWSVCLYPPKPTSTPTARQQAPGVAGAPPPAVVTGTLTTTPALMTEPTLTAIRNDLQQDVGDYFVYASCIKSVNESMDDWVKLAAVVAALFTTVSSSFGWKELGVVSGAIAVAMAGLQTVFPIADRATFYARISSRTDSVLSDLKYGVEIASNLPVFLDRERQIFETIKSDAAQGASVPSSGTPTPLPTTATPSVRSTVIPGSAAGETGVATTAAPTPTPTPTIAPGQSGTGGP